MAVHQFDIETESEFYLFWQQQKTAIIVEYNDKIIQWDTIIVKHEKGKWKDLPVYYKVSCIEHLGNRQILIHLRK